jgi:hypothetical protein
MLSHPLVTHQLLSQHHLLTWQLTCQIGVRAQEQANVKCLEAWHLQSLQLLLSEGSIVPHITVMSYPATCSNH